MYQERVVKRGYIEPFVQFPAPKDIPKIGAKR
jgi:hypothetical protein